MSLVGKLSAQVMFESILDSSQGHSYSNLKFIITSLYSIKFSLLESMFVYDDC